MQRLGAGFSAFTLMGLLSACGPGQEPGPEAAAPATLTWEQFRSLAVEEPDTGAFVTNGDELVEDELGLRQAYSRFVAQSGELGEARSELVVNTVNGRDDRWSASTAANLTYCVSQSSFGSHYSAVVSAMASASAAWEAVAHVNFVHLPSEDARCSKNSGVVFNLRQVHGGSYLARSFFPSSSRSRREVLIDQTSFGSIAPFTLTGVLRHELGHTIGFRHEHTRPEAGTCFEDNNWRALTSYDSASVMHYPQCNGTNRGDLVLTTRDQTGAASLYP